LDAAIGTHGQSVGRDQRSEQIADEPLERGAVAGIDGGVGMEREAIDERAAAARRGGSRRRLGKRQLHGLGLGVGERVGLVVDRIAVATLEQAADPAHDARGDLLDVLVGGRRQWVKAKRAIGPLVPHALGDQGMKMQVRVGERTHPLDRGDGAGLAARDAAVTRAAAMIGRHHAHEHEQHLRDQRLVAEQSEAQPSRERQRPLPVVGDHRQDVIESRSRLQVLGPTTAVMR